MQPIGTQPIETQRLLLSRLTLADAPAIFNGWASDPSVTRWMRYTPHENVGATQEWLADVVAAYTDPQQYQWGVRRRTDGTLMGTIGAIPCDEGLPPGWQVGYNFGGAYWGQGYASEALCAVVAYFFAATDELELHAMYAEGNPASGRVLHHAGFEETGATHYTKGDGTRVPARACLLRRAVFAGSRISD